MPELFFELNRHWWRGGSPANCAGRSCTGPGSGTSIHMSVSGSSQTMVPAVLAGSILSSGQVSATASTHAVHIGVGETLTHIKRYKSRSKITTLTSVLRYCNPLPHDTLFFVSQANSIVRD